MGGRGSSSASRRFEIAHVGEMSDSRLSATISDVESRMDSLSRVMAETAWDATGYGNGVPGASREGAERYRRAQREYQQLQGAQSAILQERERRVANSPEAAAARAQAEAEAASRDARRQREREVTSQTWKNAVARQERQFDDYYFGRDTMNELRGRGR